MVVELNPIEKFENLNISNEEEGEEDNDDVYEEEDDDDDVYEEEEEEEDDDDDDDEYHIYGDDIREVAKRLTIPKYIWVDDEEDKTEEEKRVKILADIEMYCNHPYRYEYKTEEDDDHHEDEDDVSYEDLREFLERVKNS